MQLAIALKFSSLKEQAELEGQISSKNCPVTTGVVR